MGDRKIHGAKTKPGINTTSPCIRDQNGKRVTFHCRKDWFCIYQDLISTQLITSVGLLKLSNYVRLSITLPHVHLRQTCLQFSFLANLALAVLKCHYFQLPAPSFSLIAGREEGNLCLMLSCLAHKGGQKTYLAASSVYTKVTTHACRLCIRKHFLGNFHTEISTVSLDKTQKKP